MTAALVGLLLTACGAPPEGTRLPAQKWDDVIFELESRPMPVQVGMNELLVLATEERGRPVHNLLIDVRASDDLAWRQTIQDGLSGVYRRAIKVPPGAKGISLRIKRKMSEDQVELFFPIELAK
ncbi:MAG TPA: hypothetical protein ENK35_05475 [Candidatus Tenderia sp.]|nr:hypothetical protein [Candidatus Tenderia sp.]